MKLVEALRLVKTHPSPASDCFRVFLACSFTPLHLATFLSAHLIERSKGRAISVGEGLFGDLAENLARAAKEMPQAVAAIVEWSDLDPRLGYRGHHGWRQEQELDILKTVTFRLDQLQGSIETVAKRTAVALCLPTLPLPLRFRAPTTWSDPLTLVLLEKLYACASRLAHDPMIGVISGQKVDILSPWSRRLDLNSAFRSGFPYHLEHASLLGALLAEVILPSAPKKGIITDLDDTLWGGTLGEDGVDGVSWDLDHNTQGHALYQQMLASLSDLGVLIAVAAKNDPHLAAEALRRGDLLLPAESVFPVEAYWGPKSASIRSILAAWNIGADSVVFVDNSPWEIAEVQAAFPDMECLTFPSGDDVAIYRLIETLRDRFGKPVAAEEDRLRAASLRAAVASPAIDQASVDEFLRQADATITLTCNQPNSRAFELVNKTNQFNLNGRRIDQSTWRRRWESPDCVLVTASYQDKFGPLGAISVLSGWRRQSELVVDIWVMSCRAFSRRIEYQMLREVFALCDVDVIRFEFVATDRNAPLRDFLAQITQTTPTGAMAVARKDVVARCPALYAKVITQQKQTQE